jgi:hypothetical protein
MTDNIFNVGIHVEITSNCNSRCLDCGRFVKGTDTINPYVQVGRNGNMSFETFKRVFDTTILQNARYVNFTGTYGEATIHPEFQAWAAWLGDAVNEYADKRVSNGLESKLAFIIETNGGLHTPSWWEELANTIKSKYHPYSRIIFGIDGTDDETHQKYRRGVSWHSVMANAEAVRAVGVRDEWSMIEFAHNEHQLALAEQMAAEIGFFRFKIRRSRVRNNLTQPKNLVNIEQKKKGISDQTVTVSSRQAKLFSDVSNTNEKTHTPYWNLPVNEKINSTDITCEWKDKKQISVDYTGRVWQCCYFSTFYHHNVEHHEYKNAMVVNLSAKVREFENLEYYEKQYAEHWNNVNYHNLSDIMTHRFFNAALPNSFENNTDSEVNPRIYRCGKHCGKHAREIEKKLNANNAN